MIHTTNFANSNRLISRFVFFLLLIVVPRIGFCQSSSNTTTDLPVINFNNSSSVITTTSQTSLDKVADFMNNNPDVRIIVGGNTGTTKYDQQLSWERVNSIITYMVEKKGISGDRFVFKYDMEGVNNNTAILQQASPDETGPNTVPPPFPSSTK